MVASMGVGKAAVQAAETADKLSQSKGAGAAAEDVTKMARLVDQPGQASNATQASAGTQGTAAVQGVSASSGTPAGSANASATHTLASVQPEDAATQATQTRGDKILHGIDRVRHEFTHIGQQLNPADGAPNLADVMRAQASMINYEVEVQGGSAAMKKADTGIETVLKGGG